MFENLALSENGFLFDSRTGNTYSLNQTGTFILRKLIDGELPERLLKLLGSDFDIAEEVAERDIEQFLFRLKDLKIANEQENGE